MRRGYFLQQWPGLADEALEDASCDSQARRGFVGLDLGAEPVPDAAARLSFRHLLERRARARGRLGEVTAHRTARGLLLRAGPLVDAPSSPRPARRRTGGGSATPRGTRPRRATRGTSA